MQVQVNDIIRSYDFKPMTGREDCFVEGKVLETSNKDHGYTAFKIIVTKDHFGGESDGNGNRVGEIVFVPHQVSFMEFAGRVINLSR